MEGSGRVRPDPVVEVLRLYFRDVPLSRMRLTTGLDTQELGRLVQPCLQAVALIPGLLRALREIAQAPTVRVRSR